MVKSNDLLNYTRSPTHIILGWWARPSCITAWPGGRLPNTKTLWAVSLFNPNTFLHTCHNQNHFSATAHMTAANYSRLCEKHKRKTSFFMIWVRVMRAARLINIVVCHLFKTFYYKWFHLHDKLSQCGSLIISDVTFNTESVLLIAITSSSLELTFRTELYWLNKRQMKGTRCKQLVGLPLIQRFRDQQWNLLSKASNVMRYWLQPSYPPRHNQKV